MKSLSQTHIITVIFIVSTITSPQKIVAQQSFESNDMKVEWTFTKSEIEISIHTPTKGWQAIGFNNKEGLAGTYLIMGRVKDQKAEVIEHYIKQPGNYFPTEHQRAKIINFAEDSGGTHIQFMLPRKSSHKYQLPFSPNTKYHLLYAYSLEDDFQHHSTMRKSTIINL